MVPLDIKGKNRLAFNRQFPALPVNVTDKETAHFGEHICTEGHSGDSKSPFRWIPAGHQSYLIIWQQARYSEEILALYFKGTLHSVLSPSDLISKNKVYPLIWTEYLYRLLFQVVRHWPQDDRLERDQEQRRQEELPALRRTGLYHSSFISHAHRICCRKGRPVSLSGVNMWKSDIFLLQ